MLNDAKVRKRTVAVRKTRGKATSSTECEHSISKRYTPNTAALETPLVLYLLSFKVTILTKYKVRKSIVKNSYKYKLYRRPTLREKKEIK